VKSTIPDRAITIWSKVVNTFLNEKSTKFKRAKCPKGDYIMANINTTNNTKNAVQIRTELKSNGIKVEYIIINGVKCGVLGSANEKDKQAGIKAIQTALDASNGNTYEAMKKLEIIATIEEKEIEPDKIIKVGKKEVIISYASKTAYTLDGKEIVNCKDLPDMPNEAIHAVLEARVMAKK
jgi:hypothetical protein